jgi:hypothetical protein
MRANPFLGHFGKGLGPGNLNLFGLDTISQGPKKSRFPGPSPLPLALVMDLLASKALRTEPYKS